MTQAAPHALELHRIVKNFPGVRALDQVDFEVRAGEIHGLVGENGAGKSTLIKILAGVYARDEGEIRIHGKLCGALTPHTVEALGVQFIHQDQNLVPEFSVAESLFLGQELTYGKWLPLLDTGRMKREAERFVEAMLGVQLPGGRLIRDLSVAERQLVQIAKALRAKPTIIAFDEPTAPLARREVDRLFQIIQGLREQGIAIIYISHYLSEIAEICDRVTVLRNGQNVATQLMTETSLGEIVSLMVGRKVEEMYPARQAAVAAPVLEVRALHRARAFNGIDFTVHSGEVVGITGLLGSGIHDLSEVLFGLRRPTAGQVTLQGRRLEKWSSAQAVTGGMGMVPRNRREQGLVLNMSVNDNINLPSLDQVATAAFVDDKRARRRATAMIENLKIRTPNAEAIVRYLSGGNQQKTVIAKWLTSAARVYILDEPTMGVDVAAKVEIYTLINDLVARGGGVVLFSSDIPELLGVADRILVMFRGQIVKELVAREATPDQVLYWATGGRE